MLTTITLTDAQMTRAAQVASKLHDRLRRQGVKDAHGLRKADATVEMESGAAAAELAASLMLGVAWTTSEKNDPYGADIGERTQVRSSGKLRSSHSLIVRSRDIEKYGDVPFLLVIQEGKAFRILGWMMSFEALKVGRLWDGGDSKRPDAWFVHESLLHHIQTLKVV